MMHAYWRNPMTSLIGGGRRAPTHRLQAMAVFRAGGSSAGGVGRQDTSGGRDTHPCHCHRPCGCVRQRLWVFSYPARSPCATAALALLIPAPHRPPRKFGHQHLRVKRARLGPIKAGQALPPGFQCRLEQLPLALPSLLRSSAMSSSNRSSACE